MSRDDFLSKWRYELAGLVFEASAAPAMSATEFKIVRARWLRRIEECLPAMYDDLAAPSGPLPAKLLNELRAVFATVKELEPKKEGPKK